ncbi:hypothetical protein VNO78_07521 [Psophocarpus tetragonolobus]|uniref:Uncharacterized protein n=1 Tax=Psophocarpus tetragonolobus TaxID=3891 RepID=A0AAN9XSH0_PSOTE
MGHHTPICENLLYLFYYSASGELERRQIGLFEMKHVTLALTKDESEMRCLIGDEVTMLGLTKDEVATLGLTKDEGGTLSLTEDEATTLGLILNEDDA